MINIPYPFKIKSIEVEIEIGKIKTTSYRILSYFPSHFGLAGWLLSLRYRYLIWTGVFFHESAK